MKVISSLSSFFSLCALVETSILDKELAHLLTVRISLFDSLRSIISEAIDGYSKCSCYALNEVTYCLQVVSDQDRILELPAICASCVSKSINYRRTLLELPLLSL